MINEVEIALYASITIITIYFNLKGKLSKLNYHSERLEKLKFLVSNQSTNIRNIAKITLAMKRAYKQKISARDRINERIQESKLILEKMNSLDCKIHVLDDRKTANDISWIAVVKHNDYKKLIAPNSTETRDKHWKIGYRYVIWAPSYERAIDKATSAFAAEAGFIISSVEKHSD